MTALTNHHNIEGLTLFTAPPKPHIHEVHAHDAYSVIVLTSGTKEFHHCGTTVNIGTHEIAIANPGELHGCGPIDSEPWSHRTWYLSDSLMSEIAHGLMLKCPIRLASPVCRDQSLARALIDAHTQCDGGELFNNQSAVFDVLERLVINNSAAQPTTLDASQTSSTQRMKVYVETLQSNLARSIELQELAELVGVQRNQVIRDFRQHKGVTPGPYLRQLRLSHAKRMIQEGRDLTSTSLDSGFADQSHFTRSFRKAFGVTPKHFQTLSRKTNGKAPL